MCSVLCRDFVLKGLDFLDAGLSSAEVFGYWGTVVAFREPVELEVS